MLRAACLLIAFAAVYADDVVELDDSNFAARIGDFDTALVKFYAPWCGHCKRMAPDFEAAAGVLKNSDNPVALVKVDCTEPGKDVCAKYDVKGFPTLKIFRKGVLTMDYAGPREKDGIIKHMRAKAGPTIKKLDTLELAEKYFGNDAEAAVVGFFSDAKSKAATELTKVADALSEDMRFAYSSAADVLKKYGYTADSVVLFRPSRMASKMEESIVKFTEELDDATIKKWINKNLHGMAGQRTTSNENQFNRPLVTVYYDVDYVKNAKGTNYWRNRVLKIAKKFVEEAKNVHFAIANAGDFDHELGEYNLKFGDKPVVAIKDSAEQKYPMTEEFSLENLEKFVRDFLDGKLKPYLKSEPIPEDNSGPVKVVVAETFQEIVNDPERDVLIEYYAPWCGHCKSLTPKYEELAEKLSKEKGVTIAKMDATANDVPKSYDVTGFPTIYYVPKNSKNSPRKFEGAREVEDFIKFFAKESTDGLAGYDRNGKKIKKKSEL